MRAAVLDHNIYTDREAHAEYCGMYSSSYVTDKKITAEVAEGFARFPWAYAATAFSNPKSTGLYRRVSRYMQVPRISELTLIERDAWRLF
jgi:hypothetical protein